MNEKPLINRVANSGLITIDLEKFYPVKEIYHFDIKKFLFKELLLKEKDFRSDLKNFDWNTVSNKTVLIHCSNDAIIPVWAYMLVASYASTLAHRVFHGDMTSYLSTHYREVIANLDIHPFENKRIVVKGCGSKPVPPSAYTDLTTKLKPSVLSIMYGEPCSTVPIYKHRLK